VLELKIKEYSKMKFDDKKKLLLATGFNSGKAPFAPGTFGTLAGIPVGIVVAVLSAYAGIATAALAVIAFIVFAVVIAEDAVAILNDKDPGCVVIDEIAGLLVACIGIDMNFASLAGAVLLFRFFDILKPFPANFVEKKLPGGAGVVLDDIIAGIMANLVLRFILFMC
jgi:phosphatidylglycerophosphatase A